MPKHHPPHIFLDDSWYFITATSLDHEPYASSKHAKSLIRDALKHLAIEFEISLKAWVILDNHYHLLLRLRKGNELPRFIGRLHGSTARQINLWDKSKGRQIWHNYWDTGLRSEADQWTHFNYIHYNPVKHRHVDHVADWPYSSYHFYLRTRGQDWLTDCWLNYPTIDHLIGDDLEKTG